MNKLTLLTSVSILLLFACRKETPLELYEGIEEVSPTCQNGIMDGQEDGVDCGTLTCKPCQLSYSIMCSGITFTDNEVYVTIGSGVTTAFEPSQVTRSVASGHLVITATNGSKTLRATFASAAPDVFRAYECTSNSNPDSESVLLQYVTGSSIYSAYSSEVNLNREGGKYTIEFCNASMSSPSVSQYMTARGRVISSN